MFFKLHSATTIGLDCAKVDVEIDINKGQTAFNIVGLPDTSIKEAKERLHSAIKNSGFQYPFNFRLLINLAPANLHKEGTLHDLPMAVGLIAASQNLEFNLSNTLIVGELALDGTVRHIPGVLSLAIFAKKQGISSIFIPEADAAEADLVPNGATIYPIKTLKQIINHFLEIKLIQPYKPVDKNTEDTDFESSLDMSMVKGQTFAKRALEIAASGGHNLLMNGPPGSGKTLLARTLPTILPPLTQEESLDATKIYSVAGLLENKIIKMRPFRSPHHTISGVALVGGGKRPRPGEISLAHRGVLFLDEFSEFTRLTLETLRQPLEDGVITISRASGTLTFPARFMLVASQNPCPCGYLTDPDHSCTCSQSQISNYNKKVSGPILDRIDLHVEVPRVKFDELTSCELAESSQIIRERVSNVRKIQHSRFIDLQITTNSEMGNSEIREFCQISKTTIDLLRTATKQLQLSARAYNRTLKIARTIADLSSSEHISTEHVAEALQFRAKNN